MELKRRLDSKIIFFGIYVLGFLSYLIYGLMPVDASSYAIDSHLVVPSIGLSSDVTAVELDDEGNLPTPDTIVGSYSNHNSKIFLFGHSSSVFSNLFKARIGEDIIYGDKRYEITAYDIYSKSDIDMAQILAPTDRDTLVLMTCAGEDYGNGDSSHRLIISAVLY